MPNPKTYTSHHLYETSYFTLPSCSARASNTTDNSSPKISMDMPVSIPIEDSIFKSNAMLSSKSSIPILKDNKLFFDPLEVSPNELFSDESHLGPLNMSLLKQEEPSTYMITSSKASVSYPNPIEKNEPGRSQKNLNNVIVRSPSLKYFVQNSASNVSKCSSVSNSVYSSPLLNAMVDVTPLPSPMISGTPIESWESQILSGSQCDDRIPDMSEINLVTQKINPSLSTVENQQEKERLVCQSPAAKNNIALQKNLQSSEENIDIFNIENGNHTEGFSQTKLDLNDNDTLLSGIHSRDPGVMQIETIKSLDSHMRREPNLAAQRDLVPKLTKTSSGKRYEGNSNDDLFTSTSMSCMQEKYKHSIFEAYTREGMKLKRWIGLRLLGEGTFSKVILATDNLLDQNSNSKGNLKEHTQEVIASTSTLERNNYDKFVAVKICENGPRGGASENRVEVSVKREIEFLKDINHPSIVFLKAWNMEESRVILVLNYYPGGDLFELASEHYDLLIPQLLWRIFAEVLAAIQYIHSKNIVHRDIKLENVLVNLTYEELRCQRDWRKYPNPVVALTDFGLSRRIKDNEKLVTRCGSDDYAAPELVMGQPYDGRATDAWSLGVVLYALLENRLPFDPIPGTSENQRPRSRTSHLIARVEWFWVKYAGAHGDHQADPEKFRNNGLEGAMQITEGLLRRARNRWSINQMVNTEWVMGAIHPESGIEFFKKEPSAELNPA